MFLRGKICVYVVFRHVSASRLVYFLNLAFGPRQKKKKEEDISRYI